MADQFPPVRYLFDRQAWGQPQYLPPSVNNLPVRPEPTAPNTTQTLAQDGAVNIRENYRYASVVTVSLGVGTTSIKFLDAPIGKRNFLGFRNASSGTQTLYIEFNATATTGAWLALTAGTIVLFDTVVPQDDLYVVASAASATLAYAYSTFPG